MPLLGSFYPFKCGETVVAVPEMFRKPDESRERSDALAALARFKEALSLLVDGKSEVAQVTLAALLAGGHVLLEDVPGVGKTTFIKAVSKLLGLPMARIQCTSDLLPADMIGVEVFDAESRSFQLHKGPIFTQILLVDELNRASPRTQSALLEAMAEGQVTTYQQHYVLPQPFMVFATQNQVGSVGTYELPESQLDRFAARLRMGYPSAAKELDILQGAKKNPLEGLPEGLLPLASLRFLQNLLEEVYVSPRVAAYAKSVLDASRSMPDLSTGISTRGGVQWLRMAKGQALGAGRDFVTPADLQQLAVPCLVHRVVRLTGKSAEAVILEIIQETAAV